MEIKKYIQLICLSFMISMLIWSCKKDDGDETLAYRPIVISYLIAGQPITFKVYDQKGLADTSAHGAAITGLDVTFSNGTKTVKLTETKAGVYTYTDPTLVVEKSTCSFHFNYNNQIVSGQTTVPEHPANFTVSSTEQGVPRRGPAASDSTFRPVTFSWTAAPDAEYLLSFKNQSSTPLTLSSGFGRLDTYQDLEEYVGKASTFKVNEMTFRFAGYYDTYLYRITPEYNDIINASGNSSLNLTNTPTNIINGFGIFTAMSAAQRLVLHVYAE